MAIRSWNSWKVSAQTVSARSKAVFPVSGALFMGGYILLVEKLPEWADLRQARRGSRSSESSYFCAGLSGFLPMIVVQVGSVVFASGLIWLGVSLWGGAPLSSAARTSPSCDRSVHSQR